MTVRSARVYKEQKMRLVKVDITDIKYRRPGLNRIEFEATYTHCRRKGVVVYDTLSKQFLTHTREVDLLAALCISLQRPYTKKA